MPGKSLQLAGDLMLLTLGSILIWGTTVSFEGASLPIAGVILLGWATVRMAWLFVRLRPGAAAASKRRAVSPPSSVVVQGRRS